MSQSKQFVSGSYKVPSSRAAGGEIPLACLPPRVQGAMAMWLF